jgi:hypothetical protein
MSLGSAYKSLSATYIDGITAPINYIQNSGYEVPNVSNGGNGVWTAFSTTITNNYPVGTINAASGSVSIGPTISNPLNGTTSLLLTVSSSVTAGNGFLSPAFFINREDQASVLNTQFAYEILSGATNLNLSGVLGSQSVGVFFYDMTNAAWVIPNGSLGMNQITGPAKCRGVTFQTPAVNAGNRYRLAIIMTQVIPGAFTASFDSFSCSPQTTAVGCPVTDWTAYTPTFTGVGTPTGVNFIYRKVGSSLQVIGTLTAGTTSAVLGSVSLPTSLAIDTTKITLGNTSAQPGAQIGTITGNGVTNSGNTLVTATGTSSTLIYFGGNLEGAATLVPVNGSSAFNSSQLLSLQFEVPIQGWSSNVQMSSDTDTRVVALTAGRTSATYNYTADTPIVFNVISQDTHGAYNTTTGQYLTPVSGFYSVESFIEFSGTIGQGYVYVAVAGTQFGGKKGWMSNTTGTLSSSKIVYANAGQTIDVRCGNTNSIAAAQNYSLSIQRLAGPSVIAASETISASYWVSANFAASTTVPINFDSKEFDSHGAVTVSSTAWRFTSPATRNYVVGGYFDMSTSSGTGFRLYKNGSLYKTICGAATGATGQESGTTIIKLLAGDYIDIRPSGAITMVGAALNADATNFYIYSQS